MAVLRLGFDASDELFDDDTWNTRLEDVHLYVIASGIVQGHGR